jgi:hypothetical protein
MLCYEADRDPAEGVPDEVFDARFGDVESDNGNLPLACTQLGDLAVSCNPIFNSVDGIDGRGRRTVNTQVDRQDGVAIPINTGQLIQARLVPDDFGVVSCDCPHVVVEACVCRTKHYSAGLHSDVSAVTSLDGRLGAVGRGGGVGFLEIFIGDLV